MGTDVLASLRVNGQEVLSPGSVNAKVYGASLVGGPEHRTPLDLPRITLESGMVVALGVSPWEGHCYPEAFKRLQASYRQKYLFGERR